MAKRATKAAPKAPRRATVRKAGVAKAASKKPVIQRSVDDFCHSMKTADLIAKLSNIDNELVNDEDRIYAIGSLQVEASFNYANYVSETLISKREFAIVMTCQKKQKVEV